MAAMEGRLAEVSLSFDESTAVSVVMASSGYPEAYETGHKISGLENLKEGKAIHSGTKTTEGVIKTNGGRVLAVTAKGSGIAEARRKAYESVDEIHFSGQTYRTDIGV